MIADPLAALFAELGRLRDLSRLEEELLRRGYARIAGVDEAGRGSLAGPVVAAAVILPRGCVLPGLDDSKKVDAESRERLDREIRSRAIAFGVGVVEATAIDAGDILRASLEAMRRAVTSLCPAPDALARRRRPSSGRPAAAGVARARRRALGRHRRGLHRCQGSPRSPPRRPFGALSGLRFRAAQGLWNAGALGRAATLRALSRASFDVSRGGSGGRRRANRRSAGARSRLELSPTDGGYPRTNSPIR